MERGRGREGGGGVWRVMLVIGEKERRGEDQ